MNSTRANTQQKIEIIEMSAKGMSVPQIAKELKRDPKTVRLWLKRWQEDKSIDAKARSGRPKKLNSDQQAAVIARIQVDRNVTAFTIKEECKIDANERTITNYLNKNGYNSYVAPKRPFHLPVHIAARLGFANELKDWTFNEWKKNY